MNIQYLKLHNFGKFHKKSIELSEGINVIYGENEAGKTTLHSFIRAMFFGAARSRGRAAANDTYSQYEPWENPGYYEGSMGFESMERNFSIDRVFQKNVKNVTLTNRDSGSLVTLGERGLESVIDGFNEESFYNTVSVSQTDTGIEGIIANLNMSGSGEINVKEALDGLGESRRKLEKKKQGLGIQEIESRLKEYSDVDDKIQEISKKLQIENDRLREFKIMEAGSRTPQKAESARSLDMPKNTGVSQQAAGTLTQRLAVILPLLAMAFGYAYVQMHQFSFLVLSAFCVVGDILILYRAIRGAYKKDEKNTNTETTSNPNESSAKTSEIQKQIERLNWEFDSITMLANRRDDLLEELEECEVKRQEIDEKINSVTVAISAIQSFSKDIEASFGDVLNELASEYISRFTRGKYDKLKVNNSMNVTICEDGRVINMNHVSYATKEQIHLSIRLAASKLLFQKEEMPVILDEAFAHYDDKRLEDTLLSLASMGNQIIIFTCTKREVSILEEAKVRYRLIEL